MRAAIIVLAALLPASAAAQRVTAYVNGRWFNGTGFDNAVFYSVDGVLRTERPAQVDTTIDLDGGYVVPPFAEAHNHNLEGSARTDATLARYLSEGIFYVMNPNNLPGARAVMRGRINERKSGTPLKRTSPRPNRTGMKDPMGS